MINLYFPFDLAGAVLDFRNVCSMHLHVFLIFHYCVNEPSSANCVATATHREGCIFRAENVLQVRKACEKACNTTRGRTGDDCTGHGFSISFLSFPRNLWLFENAEEKGFGTGWFLLMQSHILWLPVG